MLSNDLESIQIDDWLDQLVSEFKPLFKTDRKDLFYYPEEEIGHQQLDSKILDQLLRSLLVSIKLFAYDAKIIEITTRREKALFQLLIEHDGAPVPIGLREQILRNIPAMVNQQFTHGSPATDETLTHLAQCLGGHFTTMELPEIGISFVIQIPLKPLSNTQLTVKKQSKEIDSIQQHFSDSLNQFHMKKTSRILIAEDDKFQRMSIEKALLENYFVDTAENGVVAMEKVQQNQYDLIISDILMPEMNGYEFAQNVRSLLAYKKVPFLFLSSLYSPKEIATGLSTGADAYLVKPIRSELIQSHVFALLARNQIYEQLTTVKTEKPTLVEQVDEFIFLQLGNVNLGIESISRQLGLSRSSFYRAWTETREGPIHSRILEARLRFAFELLKQNDFSITQIAIASGFSDPAYFTKIFKKKFGYLPNKIPS